MPLKKQAVSGFIWTSFQQFGSQFILFVISIVLARVILPEEFGLIGMITIFMGIGSALFDGGLTSSLIRTKNLNEDDYSTVFYFNLIGSIFSYIILFLLSPFIAKFYHQPELVHITRVYGLTFVFSAFGTVQNTLLTKELKFKKQAMITLPALIVSSLVGIILAYSDYGIWSLVASALVQSFLVSLFLWFSTDWYPKFIFNKEKFYKHFHYGYKLTLSGVLDIIFTNIYQIIIGRYYSPAQVGYYTRANSLMMLPVRNLSGALNRVVFPLFSEIQDDVSKLRNAYKQIMLMVLFIITPFLVLTALLAKPLIVLLFTDKWLPVVSIFQIICFTGILYPLHLYNLLVLQVKGRSDLFLKLEVFKKIILTTVLVVSFSYGFYALLWGQVLFSVIAFLINTHYAGRMINYKTISQIKDISPIFFFSMVMFVSIYLLDHILIHQSDILRLCVGSLSGGLIYLFVARLFKFQSINDVKKMILKK